MVQHHGCSSFLQIVIKYHGSKIILSTKDYDYFIYFSVVSQADISFWNEAYVLILLMYKFVHTVFIEL